MKTHRSITLSAVTLCLVLAPLGAEAGGKVKVGKNPGQTKGRWLEVDAEKLKQYDKVCIGEATTDMQWKKQGKETPIDEALLNDKIKEHLLKNLKPSGLFDEVLDGPPAGSVSGLLRLDSDLVVDPGNRGTRYLLGAGAGKSKSILEIHLRDHATGEEIGLYHGYGVGTGMGFKVGGGGARKMTQDDIQENAKKFAELLAEVK